MDILALWNGTNEKEGLKSRYLKHITRRRNKGKEDNVMELPKITEEELILRVNNLKNGKAAGTDGIRGEVYKHMITNKKIRKAMVRGINNLWYEKDYDTQDTQTKIQRT